MEPLNNMLVLEFSGEDKKVVKVTFSKLSPSIDDEVVKKAITDIIATGILVGEDGKPVTACTKAYIVTINEEPIF